MTHWIRTFALNLAFVFSVPLLLSEVFIHTWVFAFYFFAYTFLEVLVENILEKQKLTWGVYAVNLLLNFMCFLFVSALIFFSRDVLISIALSFVGLAVISYAETRIDRILRGYYV